MAKALILGAIGFVVVVALTIVASIFMVQNYQNRAIQMEQLVERAQSNLNAEYNRRAGLLVNLAEAVMSYDEHEAQVLVELSKARTPEGGKGNVNASAYIQGVVERYPQLRSIENYDRYMTELAMTENRIASHRNDYNTMVGNYNAYVRGFPARFCLSILGYTAQKYDFLQFENAPVDAPRDLLKKKKDQKD